MIPIWIVCLISYYSETVRIQIPKVSNLNQFHNSELFITRGFLNVKKSAGAL